MKVGDTLYLDGRAKGRVEGFVEYRNERLVIFAPEYGLGRTCYGRMPLTANEPDDYANVELKLVSYSVMLVHPENLREKL